MSYVKIPPFLLKVHVKTVISVLIAQCIDKKKKFS